MVVETKTIVGYRTAKAVKVLYHHSDDTSCKYLSFGNSILKIATKDGHENVALSLEIFAAGGTAESGVAAIQSKFSEGRELLKNWCDVTCCMFPDQQDLLDKLPDTMNLTLARLVEHGWLMTDTCNTAQKFRKLLREVIEAEAKENGMM